MSIEQLIGKTLKSIKRDEEELIFTVKDGTKYRMYHDQDCCETVRIDDIVGTLKDLIGTPILYAYETSMGSQDEMDESTMKALFPDHDDGRQRWTFYGIGTVKGSVTIKWWGSSNGYYSERVEFEKVE